MTSVVIVSHRAHRWLGRCVASVVDEADEVVVVDNGSPDGEVSAVARGAGARVVRSGANRGFPAGVNLGVTHARGELVAVLNDDAWADPGWLKSAAPVLDDPSVAAVGPKILFASRFAEIAVEDEPLDAPGDPRTLGRRIWAVSVDGAEVPLAGLCGPGVNELETNDAFPEGRRQWRWTTTRGPVYVPLPEDVGDPDELTLAGDDAATGVPVTRITRLVNNAGSYLSAKGHGGDYGYQAPDGPAFDVPAERFGITGAAFVTRRETYLGLGGMCEAYFAYYEDLDWSWRARLAGMSIRYEPAGVVHHVGGLTTGGPLAERVRYLAARNRMQTLARNAPLAVLATQLRHSDDRPETGMGIAIARQVGRGFVERRRLAVPSADVWAAWAGSDEEW